MQYLKLAVAIFATLATTACAQLAPVPETAPQLPAVTFDAAPSTAADARREFLDEEAVAPPAPSTPKAE